MALKDSLLWDMGPWHFVTSAV